MFSKKEFEIQLRRVDMNQTELANRMGWHPSTITRKMQSGRFTRDDMAELIPVLDIQTAERFMEIFFAEELA